MSWYYYLENKIRFPFQARCIDAEPTSPMRKGETVEVRRLASEDTCASDMFVLIRWQGRNMAVSLSQLDAPDPDEATMRLLATGTTRSRKATSCKNPLHPNALRNLAERTQMIRATNGERRFWNILLLTDLRTFLGMLSDHYAHFSPEFEGNLAWFEQATSSGESTLLLEYFDTTKRTIHLAFVNLAGIHLGLLDVFNACFKDGLQSDGGWRFLKSTALAVAGELAQKFKVPTGDSR